MTKEPKTPVTLTGLVRVREHCVFSWQEPERGGERSAVVLTTHCAACVAELQLRGYKLVQGTFDSGAEKL
jgi:hypothetical protein